MRTHVALLRGINVGGHNRVAMADLRRIAATLDYADVATYIQSGNLVFSAPEQDTMAMAAAMERQIADQLGVQPRVVVLTRADLRAVVEANPFPTETNPRALHAVFRMDTIEPVEIEAVAAAQQRARDKGSPDEAVAIGRTLYLRTPDGLGRSVLAAELARPRVLVAAGSAGTARNWATVLRLLAMLD